MQDSVLAPMNGRKSMKGCSFLLAIVGFALVLPGCSSGDSPLSSRSEVADTATAQLIAQIGMTEGPVEYLFGDITSVAADPAGRIVVSDRIGSVINVYDSAGGYLGRVGREGQGPGEFQWPTDLLFDSTGRLIVRDGNRITFLEELFGSELPEAPVAMLRLPGYANLSSVRGRWDGERYYYPSYLFRTGEPERYFYLVFDSIGLTTDTIRVPQMPTLMGSRSAVVRTSPNGGRMVDGLNRAPFEPRASWDLTARGTVISTPGSTYQVAETGLFGDTIRLFSGPSPVAREVPSEEKADSSAALQERVSALPVPLDQVEGASDLVRSGQVPDSLPQSTRLHVSAEDKIWIGRWPPEGKGDHTIFDVFSADGEFERTVDIPAPILADPPPYLSDRLVVGVIRDPATEVQFVLVFRIPSAMNGDPDG